MGSVPQGMFAALKVHQHLEEESDETPKITDKTFRSSTYSFGVDTLPQRYSSKLMMSIWNLYNKYSPHNVKQHTEKLTSSPSTGGLHQNQEEGSEMEEGNEPQDNVEPNPQDEYVQSHEESDPQNS